DYYCCSYSTSSTFVF
nr:immunoglobulin light chain junction region [Macaca mulatta]